MSGGGGGMLGPAMAKIAGQQQGQGGAQYSAPPAANPYQSAFNSQQAPQQMQQQQRAMSPLMQQQMMRQQQPMFNPMQQQMMRQQQPMFNPMQQQSSGLQAALMQMLARQNQPMMRPQMQQMPQYGRSAQMSPLAFRPDTTQAQESLSRVKPSVQKQEQDAQAARIAELEAQLAGFQTSNSSYGGDAGGG
jgi:hypothetical protein